MKKLVILATKYSRTEEADRVFEKRGWIKIHDRSVVPKSRRVVRKDEYLTDLVQLVIEEINYGDETWAEK